MPVASPLFAVLTGDIIRSQSLSTRELESVRKSLLDGVATCAGGDPAL